MTRDVLDRLRQTLGGVLPEHYATVCVSVPANVIATAIQEIEYLRSTAGAVSQGESHSEIAAKAGRKSVPTGRR